TVVRVCACAFGSKAFEPLGPQDPGETEARGYFTRAVLNGLAGRAAHPSTGKVTVASLNGYVRREVEKLSGGRQAAEIEGRGDVVLASGNERPSHVVTISFPP